MKMHSIYSKIRGFCESRYQRYGDGFRTQDGDFTFLTRNEKIDVIYSEHHNVVILHINEDDGGNIVVTSVSPNHDPLTEKAYNLVGDILSGIGIPMPDTETSSDDTDRTSDLVKTIQDEMEKDRMRLVGLLDRVSTDDDLTSDEMEELEELCCEFFITRRGSLDWDNFKEVISNCKLKDYYRLGPGETDSFGLLSAVLICPNNHRIVFG